MSRATKMDRSDLAGFDKKSTDLVMDMVAEGWTGYVSSKGHAIMHAPDGQTTESVARDSKRARSGLNAQAAFDRWKRDRDASAGFLESVVEAGGTLSFICTTCGEEFMNSRALGSHRRKHSIPAQICQDCGKSVKYLESHRLRTHGVGSNVNAMESLLTVLAELERLREENLKYRKKYGPLEE